MNVNVDQPGHQGSVTQVNHFGVGWVRYGSAYFSDPLPFNQNFARRDNLSGLNIEQSSGMQNHGTGRRLRSSGRG